ncbi:MAG: DUF1934 domain-containing protein [Oscillospiraceae bacterium]|nr:DUF1934 domain-containing protein [Oscillospiraceae bacterium]
MEDNVIISIKGKQINENGPDEMELVTAGQLSRDEQGGITVSYQESELTGMEGTTTVVRIEGSRITLLREGATNSQMIFEVGRRHLSMYETPYGSLSVGINTSRIKNAMGECGGDLEIDYAIEIDNLMAGRNFFSMNVRRDSGIKQ